MAIADVAVGQSHTGAHNDERHKINQNSVKIEQPHIHWDSLLIPNTLEEVQ